MKLVIFHCLCFDFVFISFRDTVLHGKDADLTYDINSSILDNVTAALETAFPGIPVHATFGNHDYYPTDQFPPHNNQLYNDSLVRWGNWSLQVSQRDSFRKGIMFCCTLQFLY